MSRHDLSRARDEIARAQDEFEEGVEERARERRRREGWDAHLPKPGESDSEWSKRMNGHLKKLGEGRRR